ncbi:MAG TPA: ATP-binding protein [Myxococcota bacterium]|nr:ATP-binding protein [Myxococcota bacterium]HQK51171.1 ATP-binding protein [Myxococcota bacterium]
MADSGVHSILRGLQRLLAPPRLALRLILYLVLVVAVVAGGSAWIDVRNQELLLRNQMTMASEQLSNAIVNATWHAMLEDRRDAAYEIMRSVARQNGIEKVRIFNKEGRIVFSTGEDQGALVDKRAEACDLCHAREEPLVTVDVPTRTRIFHRDDGRRVLGMITPIYNEPACANAACHAHPPEIRVLGVLDVGMSMGLVDQERDRLRRQAFQRALVEVALLGALIFLVTRKFVGVPIRRLVQAIRSLTARGLDRPIEVHAPLELGELEQSFEDLRQRLAQAMAELNALTQALEQKVEERTAQLHSARERLAQAERMASLGRLAATVAHEINNPVAGVLNLARLVQRILTDQGIPPDRLPEVRKFLAQIAGETSRIGRIVSDLLTFSRQARPVQAQTDLEEVIDSTLALLSDRFSTREIQVVHRRGGLPPVWCDAEQMQQVLTNLLVNAVQASPDRATIVISTAFDPATDRVILEVIDAGVGIAPEHLDRIFDPFFTTKEKGKALGLGLAVVYGIVQAHGGLIEVESAPGCGATFRVVLPVRGAAPQEDGNP